MIWKVRNTKPFRRSVGAPGGGFFLLAVVRDGQPIVADTSQLQRDNWGMRALRRPVDDPALLAELHAMRAAQERSDTVMRHLTLALLVLTVVLVAAGLATVWLTARLAFAG